jgi:hypothetical protein
MLNALMTQQHAVRPLPIIVAIDRRAIVDAEKVSGEGWEIETSTRMFRLPLDPMLQT